MNSFYITFIIILFLVIIPSVQRQKMIAAMQISKRKNKIMTRQERAKMYELMNRFIGKECLITVMSGSSQIEATIKEIKDNWVIIDTGNGDDMLNMDFITRIREYPRKPNGKKKTFFT